MREKLWITAGVLLLVLTMLASADARPRHHHKHHHLSGANRSLVSLINYKLARWVHPTGKCGFGSTERLATYYWQGHTTANREHFYPDGISAAHRTLAFGTRLHISNPHNGLSVSSVRINDRGPFTNAWIDLSRGTARALGLRASSYVCVSGA